jgi:hypothetical protein
VTAQARVTEAQGLKPNDPMVKALAAEADKLEEDTKTAAALEQKFAAAMTAARDAVGKTNLVTARAQVDEALKLKPNDAGAKALAAEIDRLKPDGQTQLAEYDRRLARMEVQYGVVDENADIVDDAGVPVRRIKTTINKLRAVDDVKKLREAYKAKQWLDPERDKRLTMVETTIKRYYDPSGLPDRGAGFSADGLVPEAICFAFGAFFFDTWACGHRQEFA